MGIPGAIEMSDFGGASKTFTTRATVIAPIAVDHGVILLVCVVVVVLEIRVPSGGFLPLLFGHWLPQTVDERFGASLNEASRDLVKRMFPPTISGLAGLDWF